jgi:hypothetical protein
MTEALYFTTLAGIALSVAGFAGLVTALRQDGRWSRTELWRLRNIVRASLTLVVVALLPSPIYRAVGADEPLTIRILSALLVIILLDGVRRAFAERQEWGSDYVRRVVAIVGAQIVLQVANMQLASLPLVMFGFLIVLIYPMQLFLRVIRDFQPPIEGG